ncbi:MAG: hypothetical protein Unbinned6805contig1000_49 [Prokaryotic dsDNA virus sp.]|nr:MAG: hypothetical protein Unbinned6805contig1000_49 [Prokaryotic dsDNA virus sp.]|tara:strand:+ start:5674 stop:6129 length:456 start_codon:yes stop_codon:yes gene_type:complete
MYKFQIEKLKDIIEEIKPLLEDHWEEVAWYKDKIKLNPDYDKYLKIEELDMVVVVTVRYNDKLIGYNINFINTNLHYSDHVFAVNDIVFLHPNHRHSGVALEMLSFTEEELKNRGVSVVTFHMKLAHPFKTLMEQAEFSPQEYIYSKFIGG